MRLKTIKVYVFLCWFLTIHLANAQCTYEPVIHRLVNKQNPLDPSFVPETLVLPNVRFATPGLIEKNLLVDKAAYALESLFAAANKSQIKLFAVSGYRSYSRQKEIYRSNVLRLGEDAANKISAKPGESEHQTGLAIDVSCLDVGLRLVERFSKTKEGLWLKENAHHYGFIVRYPKGKESLTGYIYEPWHLRYVGKELAQYLYEQNFCLEEASDCDALAAQKLQARCLNTQLSISKRFKQFVFDRHAIKKPFLP